MEEPPIKISALPTLTTPDGADQLPINDVSATTTKKMTLTVLKEWFQSLTQWITNPMLALAAVKANNVDFTTGIWWEEIGRGYFNTNSQSLQISIPERKYLKVMVAVNGSTDAIIPRLRFNADTGNNYSARRSQNGATDATSASANGIPFHDSTWYNAPYYEAEIMNFPARSKPVIFTVASAQTAASGVPLRVEGAGSWNVNTGPITAITLVSDTNQFVAGTEFIVLGHN